MNGIIDFFRVRTPRAIPQTPGTFVEQEADGYGNQLVAQGMVERAHANAAGMLFSIQDTTARAALAAYPTTAALFGIFNGNQDGGKSIMVDAVTLTVMAQTATTAFSARVVANLIRLPVTSPAAVGTVVPLNGSVGYGGAARGFATPTTVAADGWFDIGNGILVPGGVTVAPAVGLEIPLKGSIIIRPQRALALSIVATATAVTGILGIRGVEAQLPLIG